jgi:inosine-uridine nucleoside N-ribohydrolase
LVQGRSSWPVVAILSAAAIAGCASSSNPSPSPSVGGPTASPIATPAVLASPSVPQSSAGTGDRRPLLIDTDVAPDDLAALAFLLASPNVDIKAITVSGTGEARCDGGVDVTLRLLDRLDAPEIPVACGRETPIAGANAFPDAWRDNADAGSDLALDPTSRKPFAGDASALIKKTATDVDDLRILTLGPMTDLADALGREPDLAGRIESVYVMGGALFAPGNVGFGGPPDNKVAEWNIYVDPTAAQMVVDAGLDVRLISLDGTNQVPVTRDFADRVAREAAAPAAMVLKELFAEHPFMTDGSYYLWDPLAAALAADHPIGTFEPARVDVEEAAGAEVGFTRPVDGAPNVAYLRTVDPVAAERIMLEVLNRGT